MVLFIYKLLYGYLFVMKFIPGKNVYISFKFYSHIVNSIFISTNTWQTELHMHLF